MQVYNTFLVMSPVIDPQRSKNDIYIYIFKIWHCLSQINFRCDSDTEKKKKCLNVFSSRHNFEKLISNNREKNSTGCFQTGRYVVLWDATLPVAVIPKIMILLGKMTSLLSQHDLYTSLFYLFASPSGAVEI